MNASMTVESVWRYPVKSMQGEEISEAEITDRGVLGDRAYALMDRTTGHIASAKHPRKWSKLLQCRAVFVESPQLGQPLPPIWITLPDGTEICSTQPDVDQVLSAVVERDVTLLAEAPAAPTREADRTPIDSFNFSQPEIIREEGVAIAAPSGTFFDYAPLHILTTATLNRLQKLYPNGDFEVCRFRPNIVVATHGDQQSFIENDWLDHKLTLGTAALLYMIDPCPRCVITTLAQGDLPHDLNILRTVGQHNQAASVTLAPGVVLPAVAGVYAKVLHGGKIHQGDAVGLK
ncbi:MOSC domain-containing protein [Phormidium tenue FACHB-886]|nr:MOSC domain-containing protein [Phormidium tenue FACHB-886]